MVGRDLGLTARAPEAFRPAFGHTACQRRWCHVRCARPGLASRRMPIGLRLQSITRTDVPEALWREQCLIKMFGPRDTVHLHPARDLSMCAGALSAIPPAPARFRRMCS